MIQNKLEECGFLAPLQDYEPVNFRSSRRCRGDFLIPDKLDLAIA